MKKVLMLSLILTSFFYGKSQVIVTLQIPSEGLSIKSQLWNAVLMNTGNTSMTIRINLTLIDISNGQQVLSASSTAFNLPQGATNITASNVLPVSYTVLNSSYNIDQSPDGFLPIGNFNICYQILQQNGDAFDAAAEECESIEVEPISPPYLNTPDDQVEIEEVRPLFTWIPPAPLSLFYNLTYKYTLVEVSQGLSSSDAIQQNIPIVQQNNISQTILQYPITSAPLDTGKNYAWQITANSNNSPVSNSEVWSFKIKSPELYNPQIKKSSFIKLNRIDAIPLTVCSDFLRYEYLNESNDSSVIFRITDITSKDLKVIVDNEAVEVQFGQNYKEINLEGLNLKTEHYYLYQLINNKNEKWFIKFQYKK